MVSKIKPAIHDQMSSVICAVNVISRSPDVKLTTGLIEKSTNSGG